jgi:hypothetical protein
MIPYTDISVSLDELSRGTCSLHPQSPRTRVHGGVKTENMGSNQISDGVPLIGSQPNEKFVRCEVLSAVMWSRYTITAKLHFLVRPYMTLHLTSYSAIIIILIYVII